MADSPAFRTGAQSSRRSSHRLPGDQIAKALSELFDEAGIAITEKRGRLIAAGVAAFLTCKTLRASSFSPPFSRTLAAC
jgi:hypothetical protein